MFSSLFFGSFPLSLYLCHHPIVVLARVAFQSSLALPSLHYVHMLTGYMYKGDA